MLDIMKKPEAEYTAYSDIAELIAAKISMAVKKREKIKGTDSYRAVFSEADSLPGLVVDIYAGNAVLQITTLGMEKLKKHVADIIIADLNPGFVYEKSLSPMRAKEGLKPFEAVIMPEGARPGPVTITENGMKFIVDVEKGSKTGFYLDQRDNRKKLEKYAAGKKVLDAFCYTGGFSVYAARSGAFSVKGIDSSAPAIAAAERNAKLNNCGNTAFEKADVFEAMKNQGEKYGLIILDPPAFSKAKDEKKGAMAGYRDLHQRALKILEPGGILFTFSCSHNVSMAELIASAKQAARKLKKRVAVLEQMFQAADHPYNTCIPETFYLKGAVLKVS